jgi:hypothetical protein
VYLFLDRTFGQRWRNCPPSSFPACHRGNGRCCQSAALSGNHNCDAARLNGSGGSLSATHNLLACSYMHVVQPIESSPAWTPNRTSRLCLRQKNTYPSCQPHGTEKTNRTSIFILYTSYSARFSPLYSNSHALIHPLYHPLSTLSTVGLTCHFI